MHKSMLVLVASALLASPVLAAGLPPTSSLPTPLPETVKPVEELVHRVLTPEQARLIATTVEAEAKLFSASLAVPGLYEFRDMDDDPSLSSGTGARQTG